MCNKSNRFRVPYLADLLKWGKNFSLSWRKVCPQIAVKTSTSLSCKCMDICTHTHTLINNHRRKTEKSTSCHYQLKGSIHILGCSSIGMFQNSILLFNIIMKLLDKLIICWGLGWDINVQLYILIPGQTTRVMESLNQYPEAFKGWNKFILYPTMIRILQ